MDINSDNLLSQSGNGYLLHCHCCNKIQFAFGNIFIKTGYDELMAFKDFIDNLDVEKEYHRAMPNNKQFIIKMPGDIAFGFTKEEVAEVRMLLEEAEIALSIKKLLQTID